MSLILDALRKSERSRQQSIASQVSAGDTSSTRARYPMPWATLIGILLIANAIVLAIIFWRSHTQVTAPITVETQIPAVAPPGAAPTPVYHPEIRSLAAEAAAVSITATTPLATVSTSISAASQNSLVTAAPITTPAKSSSSAPAPITSADNNVSTEEVPALDTLPLAFQQSLPPLHLDVYGYVQNSVKRFVVINMQRYQKGDTLKEGPKLIAITSGGAILEFHGQTFLLSRP